MRNNKLDISNGCIFGIMGGIISAVIVASVYWVSQRYQPFFPYEDSPYDYIMFVVVMFALPISLMIGVITYMHNVVFRLYNPKSSVWAVMVGLATLISMCFSGFIYDGPLDIILIVSVVSLVTGWLAHKLTLPKLKNDKSGFTREFILSSLSGFLLIFMVSYVYFRFYLYLSHIPS